jgi:hypothetical protein
MVSSILSLTQPEMVRFVQTLKRSLKARENDPVPRGLHHRLAKFLFDYRVGPRDTTNISPSKLFQNKLIKTRFDLLLPNISKRVITKLAQQKDRKKLYLEFSPEAVVYAKYYDGIKKWIPGTVRKTLGLVTYIIETTDGRKFKRHID